MDQNVFITGVSGFLGSHLAEYFVKQDCRVVGIDNMLGGEWDNIPAGVNYHNWDITSSDIHKYADLMAKADIVYHCAAAPYEGVSSFSPGFICNNVYSGSVNTFSAAIVANVPRIIYCSSMARYGKGIPGYYTFRDGSFEEWQRPMPVDPYGIAKEAAERVLINLSETHGFEYVIAVPHNIYGPRQRYYDPYRNVASIMINMMLMGRQPIIYGNGKQTRCFSYIDDCITPLALMATEDNVVGEIINIGPDSGTVTINELANKIAHILNFDLHPIYMPDRPREVKHASCSADKARKLLDYQPQVSLNEGLVELVEWIKYKGPRPFEYHFSLEIENHLTPQTWKDRIF